MSRNTCANDRLLLGELLVFVDPVCARHSLLSGRISRAEACA
jgi:hypothetical protein